MRRNVFPVVWLLMATFPLCGSKAYADSMTLSEKWTDIAQIDSDPVSRDSGTNTAVLTVPGLQSVTATAWSNLDVSVSIGSFYFFDNLSAASSLSPTRAVFFRTDFDENDNEVRIGQVTFARSGNTLTVTVTTQNPLSVYPFAFVADTYLGSPGPIQDQATCEVVLGDFFSIQRTIYLTGNNNFTYDAAGNDLNRIQVSGKADFTAPALTFLSPPPRARLDNEIVTVQARATDTNGVVDVEFCLNDGDFIPADQGGANLWSMQLDLVPGTNVIRAFALDSAGNTSTTNTLTLTYVVLAPLELHTTGKGVISGATNGQLLELGRHYTLTAVPGVGCVANWTGSQTTNKAALTFVMQSNLVFTANFVDVRMPTNTITSPLSGQRCSSAFFTVGGKATDNVQVQGVWYQLNGDAWTSASTTNGWTNWTAPVTLVPGTNTLKAFAGDTTGIHSLTNRLSFFYVVTNRLLVSISGQGKVSPNLNNAWLEIGRAYAMLATGTNGNGITNWVISTNGIGSQITNTPTVRFLMQSNLTLLANFVDVTKPTVAITNLIPNQRSSNQVLVVRGRARDNMSVTGVVYSVNGTPFQIAAGTTNWSATNMMTAGTNVVVAKSVDSAGLESSSVTGRCFYVVISPLTLLTNGAGTISRTFVGTNLEVGRTYRVTAVPRTGQVFSNWVGSLTSASANLDFLMQSNMVLQANFITNPFIPVKGTYNGLFYATNGVRHESSGFFTLTLADLGSYSGNLQIGANRYGFVGRFDVAGNVNQSVSRPGTNALSLAMTLDLVPGIDRLIGAIGDGHWMAELSADRAVFNALTTPANQFTNKYTLIVAGSDADDTVPEGDGYGVVSVDRSGKVTLGGFLADGTALSQATTISKHGQWPLYASLYNGKGSVLSWLTFTNDTSDDVHGALNWIKPAQPAAKYYRMGFTNETEALGSVYRFTNGMPALNMSAGQVLFTGGDVSAGFTNQIVLRTNNTVTNLSANRLSLVISNQTGLFRGSVVSPLTGRTNTFGGVLLQKQDFGSGYFLGTNKSGRVFFGP